MKEGRGVDFGVGGGVVLRGSSECCVLSAEWKRCDWRGFLEGGTSRGVSGCWGIGVGAGVGQMCQEKNGKDVWIVVKRRVAGVWGDGVCFGCGDFFAFERRKNGGTPTPANAGAIWGRGGGG